MFISKTALCKEGIKLPYKIKVDNPKYKIGIFGDSFAQLAETAMHNKKIWQDRAEPVFNHENTWQYYLANLLSAEAHTYGISALSIGDVAYTIINCEILYDLYIIFHPKPGRKNVFALEDYSAKIYKKVRNILEDKKVINIYWSKKAQSWGFVKDGKWIDNKIKSFGNIDLITSYHLTNRNAYESNKTRFYTDPNPLDILDSYCHMSGRGNLLLARDIYKSIIKEFNIN